MESGSLTRADLSAAVSDGGWRVILADLCTRAAVSSLRQAAEAAAALAAIENVTASASAGPGAGGELRLDVRSDWLLITLADVFREWRASAASVENARLISARLRELGLTPEPAAAQAAEIAIDALDIPAVLPFWRAVLGYVDESDRAIIDPVGKGPAFWVLADPEGNEACVCTWQARD
jgi:4a-hydroxytetrahydrobiopterin dehydratase